MRCSACHAEVALASGERVGFRDACPQCRADLHCCRNCEFHDPSAYNECRESNAERVSDRARANRCDYFSPSARGGGQAAVAAQRARNQLDQLFKK
jgi:hypothetical protein